jgi:cobalt-zinc-cadmium efflux system outer membrane protein
MRHRFRFSSAVVHLCIGTTFTPLAASPALAQQRDSAPQVLRITRDQAIRQALARNPTLTVAREQVAQAKARVSQARALPEPSVGASIVGQPGAFRPRAGNESDLSVGITIPYPGKILLQGQAAKGDLGSIDEAYTLQRQLVVFQTNQAYDSLLVSLKHRQDLEEARKLTQDFLDKTQARFNAGTVAKLDVIKAQVGVAQAENDLIANERGVAAARAALNRLLGRVLGAPIDAADSLTVPEAPPDIARLEAIAMARRPELRALQSEQAGARAQQKLTQQYLIPDLDFSITRSRPYGDKAEYETGIGIGLPIFFWQHQRGEVAEARHRTSELAAQYRDVAAQVGEDLRNAYATASTSLRQVIYLRDQLVPSAREAYRIASTSYSLGGASALEVIDAQRTLLDAQTQYAAALAAVNDAIADLERATGAPLSSVSRGGTDAR